jgi:hypothetical protein
MKNFRFLLFISILSSLAGCKPSPTEGIISVIDLATNIPVPNAEVEIYVGNPDDADDGFYLCNEFETTEKMVYRTNSGGVTERICFKLPAVLKVNVKAAANDTIFAGQTGMTNLALVEGETTTVVCKISN